MTEVDLRTFTNTWKTNKMVPRNNEEEYKNWLDMCGKGGFENFYQHLEKEQNGTKRKKILQLVI